MLLDLLEPGVEVEEGLALEQIKDQDDAVCPAVVSIRDRAIALLPRCVPLCAF